jgi:hypothetical protein
MSRTENGKPRVYVNAVLCDRIIKDSNGFLTAVTITSGYSISPLKVGAIAASGEVDESHAQYVWQPLRVQLVISFVAEEATEFETALKIIGPMGREVNANANTHTFQVKAGKGPEGHTMSINVRIAVPIIGNYWFEIYVDGELATKTPMRIVYAHPSLEHLETLPLMGHSLLELKDQLES